MSTQAAIDGHSPDSVAPILSDRRGGMRHDTATIVSRVHAWRRNLFLFKP